MTHRVTLIPGDGTGYEISDATKHVIDALEVGIEWITHNAGLDVIEEYGTPLPDHVVDSIRDTKVALKGPITTPVGHGFRSVNVQLRKTLDLYTCLRPCKYYPGVRSRYQNVDVIIVRENTEDLYAGVEFEEGKPETAQLIKFVEESGAGKIKPDSGVSLKPISISGTRRIVQYAFDYARKYHRRKVTIVHKANIMKFSDGLWLKVGRQVAEENGVKVTQKAEGWVVYEGGDIEFEDRIVDNMAMQFVQTPELYDVVVLQNLYGDIMSDLVGGLVGGLGVAPGANIGDEYAVFEATHGSAPKYKGLDKVNPTAMILSGMLMLRHLGETEAADILEQAVAAVIKEGKYTTYDMRADKSDPTAAKMSEYAAAIVREIEKLKG